MYDFQKKRKIRKILYSPIILLTLILLLVILIRGLFGVYKKAQLSARNLERERIELEKLISREKSLASSIDYLKTEQGIEDEIRTKFRVVKEGESVAVIVDKQPPVIPSVSTSTNAGNFWSRLFHW